LEENEEISSASAREKLLKRVAKSNFIIAVLRFTDRCLRRARIITIVHEKETGNNKGRKKSDS